MRLFTIISILALPYISSAESVLQSPDGKYEMILVQPTDSDKSTVIVLRNSKTKMPIWDFDYDSVGERQISRLIGGWSPDSRYVALTIESSRTAGTIVLRVDAGKADEVELMPIPDKLNRSSYTHRGGDYFSGWESGRTLWVNDNTKNRSFRYSLTDDGKFLADAFEDDPVP